MDSTQKSPRASVTPNAAARRANTRTGKPRNEAGDTSRQTGPRAPNADCPDVVPDPGQPVGNSDHELMRSRLAAIAWLKPDLWRSIAQIIEGLATAAMQSGVNNAAFLASLDKRDGLTIQEFERAHALLGWDPPVFIDDQIQPITVGGVPLHEAEQAARTMPREVARLLGKALGPVKPEGYPVELVPGVFLDCEVGADPDLAVELLADCRKIAAGRGGNAP